MPASDFIHLRVAGSYSLAEGAIKITEEKPKDGVIAARNDLISLCKMQDMPAVALTDLGNLFGALEFALAAGDAGIQPIIGCSVGLQRGGEPQKNGHPITDRIVLLAMDAGGYQNLVRLVSTSFLAPDRLTPSVTWPELSAHAEGLIALTGAIDGPLGALLLGGQQQAAEACLEKLKALFPGRLYIELQRHLEGAIGTAEARVEPALIDLAYRHDLPLVATNDVYFGEPDMVEAHDALLCISDKTVLADPKRRHLTPEHYFKSAKAMRELFADLPEACDNTLVIARRCSYWPHKVDPILPPFPTRGGRSEIEELQAQARAGLVERLAVRAEADADAYRERLEFELAVIIKMGFAGYFLIVSDFIKWAKAHRIPVGPGRGSGAGSVVAWSLAITDLDPIRFGLLFERFLNPERVSMPDFDVDFCQERRDEVIHYVQQKYGVDRVAQIITFGKLQARAVLRDVGRVMAMPYGYVDKICKLVPNNPANPVTLQQAIDGEPQLQALRREDAAVGQMMDIALKLEGLFRNASTHAAGVVIGDRPLTDIVPLYREPGGTLPATQFNMKTVEYAGLVKFDFLGLKTLDVLQCAVDMLHTRGVALDLALLPLDDAKTYTLLARGDTTGVFQLESAGMRDTLRKLKPNRFEDIIALVALYRPGPMENIPKYIRVKHGQEQADYLHPKLEPVLRETLGILIYQEQVMQAAQILAGYSLGSADLLRRAMGKKKKDEMAQQRANFIKGAVEREVPADQAGMIFDQIDKFAGYGFNKSHAAAYALIAYQTAYLKANYPTEFFAATMNFEMGDTDKLNVIRQELPRHQIRLLPPDINSSLPTFSVAPQTDGGRAIRYALAALKGVGDAAMRAIVAERDANGAFKDVFTFAERVDPKALNKKQLEGLIAAGAFDSMNPNRALLTANIETLTRHGASHSAAQSSGQGGLFGGASAAAARPSLTTAPPWDDLTRLKQEFEAVGFYLSAHPLDSYKILLERLGVVPVTRVPKYLLGRESNRVKLAGIVLGKQERIAKSGNRFAFVQASDASGSFEMTIFADLLATARAHLETGTAVLFEADAQVSESETRYIGRSVEPLKVAAERLARGVRLVLRQESALPPLAKLMEQMPTGRAKLQLVVVLDDGAEAEIDIPGIWQLNETVKNQFRALPGGAEVQEF
ncbi:MAG: DNA polymerase III subunit alpha [Alphaproteobacteria bacterium]|nr:DNA polymerase III subunit alpha [Alphaproteobacteria bacterium]